jgi:hypothetical protein
MGQAEMDPVRPLGRTESLSFAMKHHHGSVLPFSLHLDVQPGYAFGPTRSQCFEEGFFRGETRGKMRNRVPVFPAEFLLVFGEHSVSEPVLQSLDDAAESRNLNHIHAGADDHELLRKQIDRKQRDPSIFEL